MHLQRVLVGVRRVPSALAAASTSAMAARSSSTRPSGVSNASTDGDRKAAQRHPVRRADQHDPAMMSAAGRSRA